MRLLCLLAAFQVSLAHGWDGLDRLRHCLDRVEAADRSYRGILPAFFRSFDSGLASLENSVPFWRSSYDTVKAVVESPAAAAPERHLVENAVEGCEAWRQRYETASGRYLAFLAAFTLLTLVLTARVGLAMVPGISRRPDHETDASSSPPSVSVGG